MTSWLMDHLGSLLIVALVLTLSVLWSSIRQFQKQQRRNALGGGKRQSLWRPAFNILFSAAAVAVAGFAAWNMGPALYEQSKWIGKPAPELRFAHVADDRPGQLQDHQGKVVLLNIWATWCPPCREELPALDRLQNDLKDRGLVVLQISPEERDTISSFLAQQPMSTEHGYVEQMPWPINGFPTSFVIDRQGVLRKTILGPRDYDEFHDLVSVHL